MNQTEKLNEISWTYILNSNEKYTTIVSKIVSYFTLVLWNICHGDEHVGLEF